MDFKSFTHSSAFFEDVEPFVEPNLTRFDSFQGRYLAFVCFLQKLSIIPFAFFLKIYKTLVRCAGLLLSFVLVLLTLAAFYSTREFFVRQVSKLGSDLADWVLWPIAVLMSLCRLLLAAFIHPAFHFGS